MNNPRIAWLLTSAFYYWHPMLNHLAQLFPQMTAFAGKWRGYAPGFEDSFAFEVVGERKVVPMIKASTGYGSSFTYLSLNIVSRLLRFKPHVIFSNSFGMWTILALLFKPVGKWRVVIAYEGSSPSVDYCNSPARLSVRRAMVQAADACITNSRAGKSYLINVLKAAEKKVFAKPYEVPSLKSLSKPCVAMEPGALQLQRPVFVFVGSVIPRKGLHLLLEACVLLHQQGYRDYTLLVVGDGPQRQELEEFCQRHALTNCVQWAGRVDYGCLGAYFRQADVFILPTLEDTWGVVVLEAMALGKPVLCSQSAGAAEMVIDGENGYCFEPNDVKGLVEIMSQFIRNPSLADSMGHKSQELMAQHSPEAAAQFLAEVTAFVLGDLSSDEVCRLPA